MGCRGASRRAHRQCPPHGRHPAQLHPTHARRQLACGKSGHVLSDARGAVCRHGCSVAALTSPPRGGPRSRPCSPCPRSKVRHHPCPLSALRGPGRFCHPGRWRAREGKGKRERVRELMSGERDNGPTVHFTSRPQTHHTPRRRSPSSCPPSNPNNSFLAAFLRCPHPSPAHFVPSPLPSSSPRPLARRTEHEANGSTDPTDLESTERG